MGVSLCHEKNTLSSHKVPYLNWLEKSPHKRKVAGSSPAGTTTFTSNRLHTIREKESNMAKISGIVFFKDTKWGVKVFGSITEKGEAIVTVVDGSTTRIYVVQSVLKHTVIEHDDGTTSTYPYYTLTSDGKLPISERKRRMIAKKLVEVLSRADTDTMTHTEACKFVYNNTKRRVGVIDYGKE